MCGRYALYNTGQIQRRFKTRPPPFRLHDSYNVAPGQLLPVIVQDGSARVVEQMKWGLVPVWAKDPAVGYRMINARAENLFDKPAWRGPIRHHRCLVPASGFYEWKPPEAGTTKRPYYIHAQDQGLFAFAGMYDVWRQGQDDELRSYTIITTGPNADLSPIHDRMPVILHPADWDIWLDPDMQEQGLVEDLLRPYEDGRLELRMVSTDVNSVANNERRLVYPVGG